MSVGFNLVSSAMNKILGGQIITDVQTFATAFETLFGGFRQRAQQTFDLLASPQTTFVVVATAEPDALREAAYFVDRLDEESMPLSGLVVNREHRTELPLSAGRAQALAEEIDPEQFPVEVVALERHAALMQVIERERVLLDRFATARPRILTTRVPALQSDVSDLEALRLVGDLLATQG